jgi:predicted lipase
VPVLTHRSSSILNDAEFAFTSMNTTLFPGVSDDVQVHDGFAYTQGRTADDVLAAVQGALSDKKASKVLVHGHSLGAAIAMMDSLMLSLNLDSSVPISTTVFGLPRGGNQAYADLLDQHVRFHTHAELGAPG